ncbi:hypothetical protein ACFFGH_21300 [Lysobacter korlensis]|uniref:Fungal lipase-like domain-containing protein n=1 Tax=Lysobacter korlensis TaxID=553636 RepID=A0ABV6RTR6_9GAMM
MTTTDDLLLSGGGSVAVATEALFRMVAELRTLASHADAAAIRVAAVPADPGVAAAESAADLAEASRALRSAAARAAALAVALQRSAENYGELERRAVRLSRAFEGLLAERAGAWLPALLLPLLPLATAGAAGLLLGALLNPEGAERAAGGLSRGLQRHGRALTDPVAVSLLRSLVLNADDFGAGMLRTPTGLAGLLGEGGADVVGLTGTASMVVALATRFGVLRESPVEVQAVRHTPAAAPPAGFRDRADRVPRGRSQIRIERYSFRAAPDRFEVFLGGTRAAGLLGGEEPWDMTSNLHAVAELSPGSLRAAEEAMRRSGITAESEVVFTGYSQGGLLATQLAASGDWNTHGLVTFGAPVGRIEVPEGFPAVQVEHTDDLVPAFGGDRTDLGPLVVRREAFAGRELPPDVAVPAHGLVEYRSTAGLLDAARSPAVASAAAWLNAFGSGAERIDATLYRSDRIPGA